MSDDNPAGILPKHSSVATLVPTKSDAEYAQEVKERFMIVTEDLVKLLNEVKKNGFDLQFTFGPNPMGKQQLNQLIVIKTY